MGNVERICSFPPIVDGESRALVLGTMPGAESLRRRQYYGHGRNSFWKLIFALYGLECPADYDAKVRFLREKRIALWDVVESCVRPGSADADISHAAPNDVAGLLAGHPGIQAVFLNGNGAASLYKKQVQPRLARSIPAHTLPSTSPAYMIPFERKLEGWRELKEFLSKIM